MQYYGISFFFSLLGARIFIVAMKPLPFLYDYQNFSQTLKLKKCLWHCSNILTITKAITLSDVSAAG